MSLIELGQQLLEAAQRGETELIKQLMCNGAPFTTDWFGTTPLHLAAQNGHIETAEVLIKAGITIDTKTKLSRAPLHMAAQAGYLDMAKLLVQNGASVNIKDMLYMTPLHWAVESGEIALVEYLLLNGASTNVVNKFDKTPIDIAINKYRTDMVNLLKNAEQIQQTQQEELIIEHDSHHHVPIHESTNCYYVPLYNNVSQTGDNKIGQPPLALYNGGIQHFSFGNKRKQMTSNNVMPNKPHYNHQQIYNRTALSNNILFAINDNYRLKHHNNLSTSLNQQSLRLLPAQISSTSNTPTKFYGEIHKAQSPIPQVKEEFVGGLYEETSQGTNYNIKIEATGVVDATQSLPHLNGSSSKRFRCEMGNNGSVKNSDNSQLRPATAPISNTLNIINKDNVKMFLNNVNHFNTLPSCPSSQNQSLNNMIFSNVSVVNGSSRSIPNSSNDYGKSNEISGTPDLNQTIILGHSNNIGSIQRNQLPNVGLVRLQLGPISSTALNSKIIKQSMFPGLQSIQQAQSNKCSESDTGSDFPLYILTHSGKIVSSKDLMSIASTLSSEISPLSKNSIESFGGGHSLPSLINVIANSSNPSLDLNESVSHNLVNQNILLSPSTEKALNMEAQSALSSLSTNTVSNIGMPSQLNLLDQNKFVRRIFSKV